MKLGDAGKKVSFVARVWGQILLSELEHFQQDLNGEGNLVRTKGSTSYQFAFDFLIIWKY
jgi:hypothetical protein